MGGVSSYVAVVSLVRAVMGARKPAPERDTIDGLNSRRLCVPALSRRARGYRGGRGGDHVRVRVAGSTRAPTAAAAPDPVGGIGGRSTVPTPVDAGSNTDLSLGASPYLPPAAMGSLVRYLGLDRTARGSD